jgi:ABC-type uncharacterized transport system auxiliary subunit
MNKYITGFMLILMIVVTGCGSRKIIQKYYLIEPPQERSISGDAGKRIVDAGCEILPVEVSPVFSTPRIAARQKSHEIAFFQYHQWAVTPEEAITDFIEKELDNEEIFRESGRVEWELAPEYQLFSKVNYLEYQEQGQTAAARLQMSFQLKRTGDHQLISYHAFDRTEPLTARSMNEYAEMVSLILHQELQVFFKQIKEKLHSESS